MWTEGLCKTLPYFSMRDVVHRYAVRSTADRDMNAGRKNLAVPAAAGD